jgi:hypothetical protein
MQSVRTSDKSFLDALSGDDDLGCVVRCAIHIEHALIGLIENAVMRPDQLERLNLDYAGRVTLALSLGLSLDYSKPLRALGTLRNRFAHQLRSELTDSDVNNFYKSFSPTDRDFMQLYFSKMRELGHVKGATFAAAHPRDRFSIIVIALRLGLQKGAEQQRQQAARA